MLLKLSTTGNWTMSIEIVVALISSQHLSFTGAFEAVRHSAGIVNDGLCLQAAHIE